MSSLEKQDPPQFWRSFAELENSPEFLDTLADEFPEQAEELKDPLSRRRFFQLMGASMALAGVSNAAGCRWEEDYVVPLSRRPENFVPGVPKFFATSMEISGFAAALVARSFDGRPIKIEGNDKHPASRGRSTAIQQASLLHLYDPDRSRSPMSRKPGASLAGSTWQDFDQTWERTAATYALPQNKGEGLAILSEASQSPTVERLRAKMAETVPGARWFTWDPINFDNQLAGTRIAFGSPQRVHYLFSRADTILSLDCDFLGAHPAALRYSAEFASRREPGDPKSRANTMNRLYSVESSFSTTGAAADHRMPMRSELIKPLLLAIETLVGGAATHKSESAAVNESEISKFAAAVAADLRRAGKKALVCVGDRQPPEVHAIAARLSQALGALNSTVVYTPEEDRKPYVEQLAELVGLMNKGQIKSLVMLGGNPVYDAPADLEFGKALKALEAQEQSIHLSLYKNETSVKSTWHVPRAHYLEEWGDGQTYEGVYTLRQPLIRPLFGGRSPLSLIKHLSGDAVRTDRDLVRTTAIGEGDEITWRKAVQNGFTERAPKASAVSAGNFSTVPLTETQKSASKTIDGQLEVVFVPSTSTWDGRFANNAWLQETPDFMTKLTWDNAALIAPSTAADLGIANEEIIKVSIGERSIELPAYVMPGQAPSSISIALGYGREHAGVVAGYVGKVATVGVNVYPLRTSGSLGFAVGARVAGTGAHHDLATTQDHWAMDTRAQEEVQKRIPLLVKGATISEHKANPNFVRDDGHTEDWKNLQQPRTNNPSDGESFDQNLFTTKHEYKGHKWGMTIDLGKCTGCNSCMVACQAENNVPVVGKEQVMKNREMHWIRIDRYFEGSPDNPRVANQPIACQHCENAPCEQVCPVGATLHSEEGLNDMVYNRCVGTRYCANNCPYKVRRFNFHHWNKSFDDARNKVRELLFNPEVTVRSRGVMEKCSFCVQRIKAKTIAVRNESITNKDARLVDGDIQTACQQACPTSAIVFGDLNDPESLVAKKQNEDRAYLLLADLNNRPRNAFLAKIRNPNPVLEPAAPKSAH